MDFDAVEFIMDIEEHFGVTIPDEKAERFRTVGDLYAYLLQQTRFTTTTEYCPTSRVFYQLRETLTLDLGFERNQIRPDTLLRDLFPPGERGTEWRKLGDFLGLTDLPDLDPPQRGPTRAAFVKALVWTTQILWSIFLVPAVLGDPIPFFLCIILWLAYLGLICFIFLIFWFDHRYLRRVPVPKVRDLVHRMTVLPINWNNAEQVAVWTDLTTILASHTGKPAETIRPEHLFLNL